MATNETQFRSELKESVESFGGHYKVISQKFMVGTIDVHITYPPNFTAWVELKFLAHFPRSGAIKLGLTKIQRAFITKEITSGGLAGWIIGARVDPRISFAWAGKDPNIEHVSGSPDAIKEYGKKWNIEQLLIKIM